MIFAVGAMEMDTKNEVRVGVRELRGKLTHYLDMARSGTSVLVTSRGTVVAELNPPAVDRLPPRRGDILKGEIWIADDFDTWPDDIIATFESGKL